jgi:hypothetical protein
MKKRTDKKWVEVHQNLPGRLLLGLVVEWVESIVCYCENFNDPTIKTTYIAYLVGVPTYH